MNMDTSPYEDPTDDPAYQQWVESMVIHCHCSSSQCPCDGVLAGGLCDNIQDDEDNHDPHNRADPWNDEDES